jgi:hypothetical protein
MSSKFTFEPRTNQDSTETTAQTIPDFIPRRKLTISHSGETT